MLIQAGTIHMYNVMWAELSVSHFSMFCKPKETGANNDFQRKLLCSIQLSDYGATKVSLYSI